MTVDPRRRRACFLWRQVDRSMCMEKFDDMPHLGRFTLRTEGKTIAIGKILAVQKQMPK